MERNDRFLEDGTYAITHRIHGAIIVYLPIVSDQQLEYGLISFCELLFNFHILSGVRTWDAVRISRDAVRISWMQSEYSWNIENMLIYFSITF